MGWHAESSAASRLAAKALILVRVCGDIIDPLLRPNPLLSSPAGAPFGKTGQGGLCHREVIGAAANRPIGTASDVATIKKTRGGPSSMTVTRRFFLQSSA